jgi:hypothetical protein
VRCSLLSDVYHLTLLSACCCYCVVACTSQELETRGLVTVTAKKHELTPGKRMLTNGTNANGSSTTAINGGSSSVNGYSTAGSRYV